MSRKRRNRRPQPPPPSPGAPPAAGRLSLGKRLGFGVITAGLVFAALELGLALLGVKPITYARDPYVGFSARLPLFVEERGPDGRAMMVTAANKLRLFNEQRFPKRKAPGTFRIFAVGGSTTYGRPYDDRTSFAGWLREFLPAAAPERKWEVINAGGISYASYRVALLMEELIRYQPDLFIVYSGHNEFLEERTYGNIRDLPDSLQGLGLLAAKTRTGALMQAAMSRWNVRRAAGEPTVSTLEAEVVTRLDQTVGPKAFHRDDTQREQILRHYRFNLARICEIARSVGADVILVTPASSLRSMTPFKSDHRHGLSPEELARWQAALSAGTRALTNQLAGEALTALDRAVAIDDRHAYTHFLRGQALEALARFPEAKTAYERARDEDVCPLRALSPMPAIVREVAAERHVPLVDFAALQDGRAPHGIPGSELFLDHVHPTVESHRALAFELAGILAQTGRLKALPDAATFDQVAHRIIAGIDTHRNALALANLSKVLGWAGKHQDAYRLAAQAVGMDPEQAAIQYQAGLCAQLLGRPEQAVAHYGRAVELDPASALAHGNLGVALEDLGRLEEAAGHFEIAIRHGDTVAAERNRRNLERVRQKLR
ncbi:MAG: tetratricopeptide repeat protein [Verrucomicrobiales bacterium]|nr:tetratricopeptide repeat protein [Verrucomicrobiales bacterium]MCP5525756.1 tetratricopeptide repeat protein [Verrucomicrobiales bacterium]